MIPKKLTLAAVIVASLTLSSFASFIETEPNDTLATANSLGRVGSGPFSEVGVPRLSSGDVDVFSIDLFAGEFFLANTAGIAGNPPGSSPDTIISLVDSSGTIIEFDDDDAQSLGSNYTFKVASTGTYYVGVSAFGDTDGSPVTGQTFGDTSFIGDHTDSGRYILTVSVVPEPAALGLFAIGCVALGLLRRRS